jgi:glycosyltransferase involved in cell wall biosynthesis
MKILCLIDSLGPGGAQRQLVKLATGLKQRGHDVRFLVYHTDAFFLPFLVAAGIGCEVIPPCSWGRRFLAIRKILRRDWQDVVLAFLEASCLYAELSSLPRQGWGLVVGERLADPAMGSGRARWLRHGHRLADSVVTNSHTNRLMLSHGWPFLNPKLTTIYNTVDLSQFKPDPGLVQGSKPEFRIVVAASYQEKKNMGGVASALKLLRADRRYAGVVVDWYGSVPADPAAYNRTLAFIEENGLAGVLNLNPSVTDLARKFAAASAVGLFSFFEGLPNVVCEGMACGKPILLSRVCDADSLVREGRNGFLCDPASPESMAAAIRRLADLDAGSLRKMGEESRGMAEALFDETTVLSRYEAVLQAASRGETAPAGVVWPPVAPDSAVRDAHAWTVDRCNGGINE